MSLNTDPIVVEQTLDAAVAAVWKAITDPAQITGDQRVKAAS